MIFRYLTVLMLLLGSFFVYVGCDSTQREVIDAMRVDDPKLEMPGTPVSLVAFVSTPEGGEDAYLQWGASVAETLAAPKEVLRIRGYENVDPTQRPQGLTVFEFASFLDAATYLNRPEIAAIMAAQPNYSETTIHTFIRRSDYSKEFQVNGDAWQILNILLIDYPIGGKDAYLQWAASVSSVIQAAPHIKTITSYDNYYGESPHRLVMREFANPTDVDAYIDLEETKAIQAELDEHAGSWVRHTFVLRSDSSHPLNPFAE